MKKKISQEDAEFIRRTKEAYKRHEEGKFRKLEFDDFIKEMRKW